MIYAIIQNGRVQNLIELNPEQESEFPGCVSCEEVPAHIGDAFDGENFYRDGERVKTYAEIEDEQGSLPHDPYDPPDEPSAEELLDIILGNKDEQQ